MSIRTRPLTPNLARDQLAKSSQGKTLLIPSRKEVCKVLEWVGVDVDPSSLAVADNESHQYHPISSSYGDLARQSRRNGKAVDLERSGERRPFTAASRGQACFFLALSRTPIKTPTVVCLLSESFFLFLIWDRHKLPRSV